MKLYWYIYNNSSLFRFVRHFYLYVLKVDFKFQIIAFLIFVILTILSRKKYKRKEFNIIQAVAHVVLPVYIFVLFASLVCSRPVNDEVKINLMPFWTEQAILMGESKYIRTLIQNVLMLVPWGFLLPIVKKVSFFKSVFSGFIITFLIELLQLLTKTGLCELDDVIHNTIGVIIGYGIWKQAVWIKQKYITWKEKD